MFGGHRAVRRTSTMLQIIGILLPLFATIGLGKAAIQWRFLDASGAAVLSRFTFFVPMPALMFGLMAELNVTFGMSAIYFVGVLVVYDIALCTGRWLTEPSLPHRAVFALDTTFGNVTFLGVPLISSVWGKEGLSHLVGIIVFTTILIPLSTTLMEIGDQRRGGNATTPRNTILNLLKNPVISSVILGLIWRATGLPVPVILHNFLDLLGRAAAPLALFCLGTSLPAISPGVIREGLFGTFLKLAVLPLVVGLLCYGAGFTGLPLAVAVLAASLPTGANAFLIARGTTTYGESSATTMIMATSLSIVTLPAILYLLE
jgi:malonate transporter